MRCMSLIYLGMGVILFYYGFIVRIVFGYRLLNSDIFFSFFF